MSIFPAKILFATDGSSCRASSASPLPRIWPSTNLELHVAYVFPTAVQRPFPNPITSARVRC